MQIIEWGAVIAALIYVYFASKAKRICFLFGLLSSIGFVYVCFAERLYFDTAINLYYIIMSFVGWFSWTGREESFQAEKIGFNRFLLLILTVFACTALFGFVSAKYTDAQLSYVDAFTTITAIIATWMMVKKYIENWLLWIVANCVSIFMYAYKEHLPIAGLFLVYTVISFYGYYNWKKLLKTA